MRKRFGWITVLLVLLLAACAPDSFSNSENIEKSVPAGDPSPDVVETSTPDFAAGTEGMGEAEPEAHETEYPLTLTVKTQPAPGKDSGNRGNVYPDGYDVVDSNSEPGQKALQVTGTLPTPCHHIRFDVSEPDAENRIEIDLYSVSNPEQICAQVLAPFEIDIPLGALPVGDYSIWVNGNLAGELHLTR